MLLPNIGPRILNPSFGPNRGLLQRFMSHRGMVSGKTWHNLASAGTYLTFTDMASGEGWIGGQTPGGNPSLRLQDSATPWSRLLYTGPTASQTAWTMAAWVKPRSGHPSGNSRADVITRHGATTPALQLIGHASGGVRMQSFLPTTNASATVLTTGSWYRMVFTCDGTNTRFYVNGVLTDTFGGSTAIAHATTVGQYSGAQSNALWGEIDDVCFANRSWVATDVSADYQDGTNGYMRSFLPDPSRMVLEAAAAASVRSYRPWFGAQTRSL